MDAGVARSVRRALRRLATSWRHAGTSVWPRAWRGHVRRPRWVRGPCAHGLLDPAVRRHGDGGRAWPGTRSSGAPMTRSALRRPRRSAGSATRRCTRDAGRATRARDVLRPRVRNEGSLVERSRQATTTSAVSVNATPQPSEEHQRAAQLTSRRPKEADEPEDRRLRRDRPNRGAAMARAMARSTPRSRASARAKVLTRERERRRVRDRG